MKRETIDKKLEALKRKEERFQEKVNAWEEMISEKEKELKEERDQLKLERTKILEKALDFYQIDIEDLFALLEPSKPVEEREKEGDNDEAF